MPDEKKIRTAERQRVMLQNLRTSGVVDFDKLGDVVKEVSPQLFDPGTVADDYVVKGYSSVLQIWKVGVEDLGLEEVSKVRDMSDRITKPGR